MDEKYIELILKRCLDFSKTKSLFIGYNKLNYDFVSKVVLKAKEMGIDDIFLEEEDSYYKHDLLKKMSISEIENDDYFKSFNWDIYAKKDACFLFIETEIPGLMDDVDPEKLAKAAYIKRSTKPIYNQKRDNGTLSWCIAAYPNELWAKDVFKDDPNAYQKLLNVMYEICMVDQKNPIESWNNYLSKTALRVNKLNDMHIKTLHYQNGLGTDLYIELPENSLWSSAFEEKRIVNMPSYEIFTSPNYLKTEGIVYSALPLMYNGAIVEDFYLKFHEGRVVDFDAKVGKDILAGIIESDPNACFLGECALINVSSPIAKTGLVFNTTLIDENASCHLALGAGFNECILNGLNMTEEELLEKGINQSKNHVDFMIGTDDMNIEAETEDEKVLIFKNGEFTI